jgi:ribulose-phosphate 3-epimerase
MKLIAPSLLSANFLNLEKDIVMLNDSQAQWIHVDVMDGVFVPNISFGLPILKAVRTATTKVLDVHLMIIDNDKYIDAFKDAGADNLTVHIEACTHLHRTIQAIKAAGMKAGVAINPHTPIAALSDIIIYLDVVCIMSVNPGFGAQTFIENTYSKVAQLQSLIKEKNATALIEVDGGVNYNNANALFSAGANVLVAGNAVFSSKSPAEAIQALMA